jgi:phosphatidylserine/phosphatidylglycerophosphate/cardiolipin synthase-like enzyme
MPTSSNANDVLVFGDNLSNIYFLDANVGTLVSTQSSLFGTLKAPATLWNGIAFCPTSNPGGGGAIYAFSAQNGTATWEAPLQLGGSIDAPIVIQGTQMYAALSSGFLFAFDISAPLNPNFLWNLNVLTLASGTATINGLTSALGGQLLLFTTSVGIYAVDFSKASNAMVAWYSQSAIDFSSTTPLLVGSMFYASAGSTLYGWDINATPTTTGGTITPIWSVAVPSAKTIASIFWLGLNIILVVDVAGGVYLADGGSGAWCGPLTITAPTGAFITLYGNLLFVAGSAGVLAVYRFDPTDIGLDAVSLWSVNCGQSISCAPYVFTQVGPTQFGPTVFQPLLNGTVAAYKVTDGSVLWSGNLGGTPSTFGRAIFNVPTQATASATFLLDGQNYFTAARNSLIAAINKSFATPSTLPTDFTFTGLVKAVGASNSSAFVLLWDVGNSSRYAANIWEKMGLGAPINFYANKQTIESFNGASNVNASLDPYSSAATFWDEPLAVGASNHQKILIVCVAGNKLAFVGGMNMVTPEYWDSPTHPMSGADLHNWHDTGLVLQGSAVDLVEREFDRRWTRQKGTPPQPISSTYVKAAYWQAVGTSCMDEYSVCNSGATPTPYTNPTPITSAVPASVLLTNSEARPSLVQIRQALVAAIANATNYIYFENAAFYDGALIRALMQRLLSSAGQQLNVIINIPQPQLFNDSTPLSYFALSRTALLTLQLGIGTWTSFTTTSGQTLAKAGLWSAWVTFSDNGIEAADFRWQTVSGGLTNIIRVADIASLASSDTRVVVCGPARYFSTLPTNNKHVMPSFSNHFRGIYVHSKLALVDDALVVIGSANFTERSMRQDGEIMIAINDPSTAAAIRQTLFAHWGQSTPALWKTTMQTFTNASADAVGILPINISNIPGNATLSWLAWASMSISEI